MSKIMRRVISTAKAPAAIGPYSQAVQVGSTLYVSGQLGLDTQTMNFVSDSVVDQAKKALENMGHILEAAGTSYGNVVKTTVLLKSMEDFGKVNDVYASFFKEPYPARAAYECANLPKYGLVEIEAVAVVGELEDK
ncbi:hypothetical protein ACHWQZ_G019111 [Mnemiopsis leidyi]